MSTFSTCIFRILKLGTLKVIVEKSSFSPLYNKCSTLLFSPPPVHSGCADQVNRNPFTPCLSFRIVCESLLLNHHICYSGCCCCCCFCLLIVSRTAMYLVFCSSPNKISLLCIVSNGTLFFIIL